MSGAFPPSPSAGDEWPCVPSPLKYRHAYRDLCTPSAVQVTDKARVGPRIQEGQYVCRKPPVVTGPSKLVARV